MTFALGPNDDKEQIIDAINYLLSNLGQSNTLLVNNQTGQITNPYGGQTVAYLYQNINVRYSTSRDGTQNFSDSPTNATYYGLQNTDSPFASTNPTDYVWYQVQGGFGTTKFLWYSAVGGRQILFEVSSSDPGTLWLPVQDGVTINLDELTGGNSSFTVQAYARANSQPATPTANTGSWDFTTNSGTPPVGPDGTQWYLYPIDGSSQLWISTAVATIVGVTGVTTDLTWTVPSQVSSPGTNGSSLLVIYSRVPNNPVPLSNNIVTSGTSSPTQSQSNIFWGVNSQWFTNDPNPGSSDSLYISYGTYNPTNLQTVWDTPFIASLKVPTLATITPALGSVSSGAIVGNITVDTTGYIFSGANINGAHLNATGYVTGANANITNTVIAKTFQGNLVATSANVTTLENVNTLNANTVNANTTLTLGTWTIRLGSTGGLLFQTGGSNVAVLQTNGNLVVSGNVVQNGTPS